MADEENKGQEGFDANKFKQDIIETNKEMIEGVKGEITSSIQSLLAEHAEKLNTAPPAKREKVAKESLDEFRQELEEIGIDEDQGEALLRMVDKLMSKKTASFEENVLKKVDEKQTTSETVKGLTAETLRAFPAIKDKKSDLFRESQKIYRSMSDKVKAAPEAEMIAVERAALKLGIKPISLEEANAWDAQNPGGSGGERKPKKKEMSTDLAKFFNVDPKKVNEKLREKGYFN